MTDPTVPHTPSTSASVSSPPLLAPENSPFAPSAVLGDLQPPSTPLEDLFLVSGDHLHLKTLSTTTKGAQHLDSFRAWIDSLIDDLSPTGQMIARHYPHFTMLDQVFNCGAAHTKLFGPTVDHTRKEHCVHAAHSIRGLTARANLGLSDYEQTVLELVMLLHDPHRLGSHALDHVFASIPGAPPISTWGWSKDFHEYHGAKLVAKDTKLQQILGEYWADAFAILAYCDKRPLNDPSRVEDYGIIHPTLSPGRITLLHKLKDIADRSSYLILDYVRSGLDDSYTTQMIETVERFERSLEARDDQLVIRVAPSLPGEVPEPINSLVASRQFFAEHIATHPSSCLVDGVLRNAAWKTISNRFPDDLRSAECYHFAHSLAMQGDYERLFGRKTLQMLNAPRAAGEAIGLEDFFAPLITLSQDDFSMKPGKEALARFIPPGLAHQSCGIPRQDMSILEYQLRDALKAADIDVEISLVVSNDFEKIFEYCVVEEDHAAASGAPAPSRQLGLLGVRTSDSVVKVIVAARALDENGQCINLGPARRVARHFFENSRLLKNPASLDNYDPRAFVTPLDSSRLKPENKVRIDALEPAWITRGGCGLIKAED